MGEQKLSQGCTTFLKKKKKSVQLGQNSRRQKGDMKQVTCQGCTMLSATIQKLGAKDFCFPGVDIETNWEKKKKVAEIETACLCSSVDLPCSRYCGENGLALGVL